MAFSISRSQLSKELQEKIVKDLSIFPEDDFFAKQKFRAVSEPVPFFVVNSTTVQLPIAYASKLFGVPGNDHLQLPTMSLQFTGTLREKQIPVAEEAYGYLKKYGAVILALHPGFGKTIEGAYLAAQFSLLTVILVHRELLLKQWDHTFSHNTDARTWIVGEPLPTEMPNVIICMDTRWGKIPPEWRSYVGTLIIDEAHAFCTRSHVECLLAFQPKYVIAESASLERDDEMHKMILAITGNIIIYRDFSGPFTVYKTLTGVQPERTFDVRGQLKWSAFQESTLMNEKRNAIILNLIRGYAYKKILVLTALKEHTKLLHGWVTQLGIGCDFYCGTKKAYQDAAVLVGTMSKIGTGFDPATSCDTYDGRPFEILILASSIKKYAMLTQNVGRVFRCENPTIFHLVDDDPIYQRHWTKCLKWYTPRGGSIIEWKPNFE